MLKYSMLVIHNMVLDLSNNKLPSPNKNPQKILIATILATIILVVITMAAYFAAAGTIEIQEASIFVIIAIIVIFATYILYDISKNTKQGLPAGDERTKNLGYKAGYYGFIAAIWSSVFGPSIANILFDYEMPGDYVSAIVVLAGGLTFALSYIILNRKGR